MKQLAIIVAFVLLLRLPFLDQAIQGDDVYYLAGAQHAQVDPLHPHHARYFYLGQMVDMRGHPHPPLNAWALGVLLAIFGDVREGPYHAVYILFSLIAAVGMWRLAQAFSPRPLWATLLFCVTPAFVVNGNSLEADVPFAAFWIAAFAFFLARRFGWAAAALALASLAAYQAVVATPILWVWCWLRLRDSRQAWLVSLTPILTIGAFQLYERWTSGALPAAVLAGYMASYGLQQIANKLRNAAALAVHLTWIVNPLVLLRALFPLRTLVNRDSVFLLAWIGIYFAAALVLFFAGSARYLLPIAPAVCLLVSQRVSKPWLIGGVVAQAALALALATVNYFHWNGYRQFAAEAMRLAGSRRVWVNGEWGLRYYLESLGAMPVERDRALRPGDVIVSTELGYPVPITHGGGTLAPLLDRDITAPLPLRLIGLGAKSAYSTAQAGLRPFDIVFGPIDRVHARIVIERKPTLSWLPMSHRDAAAHIVSGVYDLEEGRWRWTSRRAVFLLRPPPQPRPFEIRGYIPPQAAVKEITVTIDGNRFTFVRGSVMVTPPLSGSVVTLEADRTFSVPGDHRELGFIVSGLGFVP
ncbi:MAG TPA: hypothetical protein VFL57_19315 [Bryobacteraceae bacterium]|nr:hypothetical protein [Bryobacteraceae bacterium]